MATEKLLSRPTLGFYNPNAPKITSPQLQKYQEKLIQSGCGDGPIEVIGPFCVCKCPNIKIKFKKLPPPVPS